MSVNYDPDRVPELPEETFQLALSLGLQVVHVICDEEGAKVGDNTGVSFIAMTPFLPRPGDRIGLEDGSLCEVRRAIFKLTRGDGRICLIPNVFATLIPEKPDDDHTPGDS